MPVVRSVAGRAVSAHPAVSTARLSVAALAWADRLADALHTEYLFQHVAVFLDAGDALVLAAQRWGAGEDVGQVVVGEWAVPFDGSVVGRVFSTASPALVSDVGVDPDYRGYPGGLSRSELAVPIVVDGRTAGVLNLESPRIAVYDIRDLETAQAQVAAAVGTFPGAG